MELCAGLEAVCVYWGDLGWFWVFWTGLGCLEVV